MLLSALLSALLKNNYQTRGTEVKFLAVIFCSLMLAGCGGGGSGGGTITTAQPLPAASFPVEAALVTALTTERTFSSTCTPAINGVQLNMSQTFSPQTDAPSPWTNPITKVTASLATLIANGVSQSQVTTRYYFTAQPLLLYGHQTSHYPATVQRGENAPYVTDSSLPTAALVGSSGPFVHYNAFNIIGGELVRRGVITWSLDSDTADTAWFCLHITVTDAQTGAVSTETDCYLIDAAGKALRAKFNTTVNGQPFTCGG